VLQFGENHVSEKAAKHLVEALKILYENFDDAYLLRSKIHYINSRIAFNFSDGRSCKLFAMLGLDNAVLANDTAWIARSCSNLGITYERMGKAGEGDTAYMYCDKGFDIADAKRYPLERAYLENTYANCLRHSHDYDSAICHFNIAKSLIENDVLLYHKTFLEEAFVYYQKHDYQTAIAELEVAIQAPDHNIRTQSVAGLADCWEKVGDTLKAAPYLSMLRESNEKEIVDRHHNNNALPILNAYLQSLDKPVKSTNIILLIVIILIATVIVLAFYFIWKKRHLDTIKDKDLEALRLRGLAIFSDKYNKKMERIRNEFNAAYPDVLANLKAAHPDLTDTELDICILSFFSFRLKETADIINLRENTVAKYRTAIKKKLEIDDLKEVFTF
jgi:tetratricopeptide (TPR) repeat protein